MRNGAPLFLIQEFDIPMRFLRVLRFWIGILASTLACQAAAFSGEDYSRRAEMMAMVKTIEKILVAEKVCASPNVCRENGFYFVSPYKNGMSIQTFGVRSQKALMMVADAAATLFFVEQKINIVLHSYWATKKEHMSYPLFNRPDAFLEISLIGERK